MDIFKLMFYKWQFQRSQQKESFDDQLRDIESLESKLRMKLPHTLEYNIQKKIFYKSQGIYSKLQTEMMLQACIWAMIAAIAACITVILTLRLG